MKESLVDGQWIDTTGIAPRIGEVMRITDKNTGMPCNPLRITDRRVDGFFVGEPILDEIQITASFTV